MLIHDVVMMKTSKRLKRKGNRATNWYRSRSERYLKGWQDKDDEGSSEWLSVP